MAEDRREELLRKAVETSLIWNDDNQAKGMQADYQSAPVSIPSSADVRTDSSSPIINNVEMATQETPSSVASVAQAEEQVVITEERPHPTAETQETEVKSILTLKSSASGPGSQQQAGGYRPEGPIGIDIGTTCIVIAEGREKAIHSIKQTRFSTPFPIASYTKSVLIEHEVPYFELSNFEYLQGYATEMISNSFHGDPQWQYSKDFEKGQEGLSLIEGILQNLLGRPKIPAVPLYFSVPGELIDGGNNLLYHTGIIQAYLSGLGYSAKPVNEGLAVVMAELADNNFTGVGVSIGGSMCHVCLAYLSIPVVSFSIQKAGNYIDKQVSACTGELLYNVTATKENNFNLLAKPADHVDRALRIYYHDVVKTVVEGMKSMFRKVDLPINGPIPIVFSGGVMKTEGLLAAFDKALKSTKLAVEFSRVQQANDPATSVVRGALVKAMVEEF